MHLWSIFLQKENMNMDANELKLAKIGEVINYEGKKLVKIVSISLTKKKYDY